MPHSNSKKITKKKAAKKKFSVAFGNQQFSIMGRTVFNSAAKKIKVNQIASKGNIEDRRHILHWDEVLKPSIEQVISNLYKHDGYDEHKVARRIALYMKNRGLKRLPKKSDKIMERFVTEINSAPDNLIPDRADTNKAIEVVRGYIRKYVQTISTPQFAEDCQEGNTARMALYKKFAKETFIVANDGGDITQERNRIHREILQFVDGCSVPAQLWVLMNDLIQSVTFDFSQKTTRDHTVKALEWQKNMRLIEGMSPEKQLEQLGSIF
jgi:hypothetical protein